MSPVLPPENSPRIRFRGTADLDAVMTEHEITLLVVCEKSAKSLLKQCRRSPELLREYDRLTGASPPSMLRLTPSDGQGGVLCIFVKSNTTHFARLQTAGKTWRELAPLRHRTLAVATLGLDPTDGNAWLEALLAAALAGSASLPTFKRKAADTACPLTALTLVTAASATSFATCMATQRGNHLARWLTLLPPNHLTCATYRKALQTLAKQHGWKCSFLDVPQLHKRGAGAFLAVARANPHADAGILRLSYQAPGKRPRPKLALVGKGICFDTGGINLKSHKGMYDMHTDMQGSAVAVGTLLALSALKARVDIDCWLALTENEIGPNAYRPQEVVTALNGTTIQVVHSDAEGRMALADTLVLAASAKPDLIIDFATLTGACVQALTERMSGAFTNQDALRAPIEQAGRDSGERVWSFPMDSDFDSDLDSPIADLMQCTMDNKGDHILAARFLGKFVPDTTPWIHIDLSAASRTGGLGHVNSEITGFGVRWAVQFLQQHLLAKHP